MNELRVFHRLLFSLCIICGQFISYSQTVVEPYEVGTWFGFRSAAISYTFDDGTSNQFNVAIPMFDKYGYKLTMFTVTGWGPDWSKLKSASKNGHEIGNHTVSHPDLSTLSFENQASQLENSNKTIIANIPDNKGLTLAYPFCKTGNTSLVNSLFIGARICSGVVEKQTPDNLYAISSIGCGSQGRINSVEGFNSNANSAAYSGGWVVYLLHGINNDGGYSSLSSSVLESSLTYLKGNDSKFWVETFGNVIRYIQERNSVSIIEKTVSDTLMIIEISDTLENEIYNYPISIRRHLPEGWSSAKVLQNNNSILDTLYDTNTEKYVQFNAIPDGGDVLIIKDIAEIIGNTTETSEPQVQSEFYAWLNSDSVLNYSLSGISGKEIIVRLISMNGIQLCKMNSFVNSSGAGEVNLSKVYLTPGVYIFVADDGTRLWTRKISFK